MISRNMRRTRSSTIVFVVLATCLLCLTRPSFCDVRGAPASNEGAGNASHEPKAANEKPAAVEPIVKTDVAKSNNSSSSGNNNNNNNNSKPVEAAAPAAAAAAADAPANHDAAVLTSKDKPTASVVKVKTDDAADSEKSPKMPEQPEIGHSASLNSGAMLRGFLVFVGLGVLALAYMVFRSFRLNKSRTQMVRKYGVLAHKQDIEMRPLPLDEDDEDDTTVFDASGLSLAASSSRSNS